MWGGIGPKEIAWLDVGVARARNLLESIGDEYFSFRGYAFSGKHIHPAATRESEYTRRAHQI